MMHSVYGGGLSTTWMTREILLKLFCGVLFLISIKGLFISTILQARYDIPWPLFHHLSEALAGTRNGSVDSQRGITSTDLSLLYLGRKDGNVLFNNTQCI